jgi:hypothetical protein
LEGFFNMPLSVATWDAYEVVRECRKFEKHCEYLYNSFIFESRLIKSLVCLSVSVCVCVYVCVYICIDKSLLFGINC